MQFLQDYTKYLLGRFILAVIENFLKSLNLSFAKIEFCINFGGIFFPQILHEFAKLKYASNLFLRNSLKVSDAKSGLR